MSDAAVAASVAPADMVAVVQPGGIALATIEQVNAAPSVRCSALEGVLATLAARVAVLEGRAVVLAGALPVATLQVGSTDLAVPVAGLLRTDTVSIEIEADLPAGLDLRAVHPDRTRDGVLLVQATAGLQVTLAAAVPMRITAVRVPS